MLSTTADARFWNRIARKYANDRIKDEAGYERTLERTRELLNPDSHVLEIGCGTGTTALRLAPSVASIVASDVSSEMIAIAEEKATAQRCPNATFTIATADQAPGTNASYDAVLAFNVLHLVADRPSTLARVRDLLKPGGLFISKTPCLTEMSRLIRYAVPVARLLGKAPHVSFFSALDLTDDVAAAGFKLVAQERHGSARKDARIFVVARKA